MLTFIQRRFRVALDRNRVGRHESVVRFAPIRNLATRLAGKLDPEFTDAELAQAEWEDWLAAHPFVSEHVANANPLDAA